MTYIKPLCKVYAVLIILTKISGSREIFYGNIRLNNRIACVFSLVVLVGTTMKSSAAFLSGYEFSGRNLFTPHQLGNVRLVHENKKFKVLTDSGVHEVQNCFVDKEIRNISTDKLALFLGLLQKVKIDGTEQVLMQVPEGYFTADNQPAVQAVNVTEQQRQKLTTVLAASGYLSLNKMSDGQYAVRAKLRLPGGGPIGATIGTFLGVGLTYCRS